MRSDGLRPSASSISRALPSPFAESTLRGSVNARNAPNRKTADAP